VGNTAAQHAPPHSSRCSPISASARHRTLQYRGTRQARQGSGARGSGAKQWWQWLLRCSRWIAAAYAVSQGPAGMVQGCYKGPNSDTTQSRAYILLSEVKRFSGC